MKKTKKKLKHKKHRNEHPCNFTAEELERLLHVDEEHRIHLDDADPRSEDDGQREEFPSATNKFLTENYTPNIIGFYIPRPRAKCKDGYTVSIQGGSGANVLCWPHEDTTEFTHVMLTEPSWLDEELLPYYHELEGREGCAYCFVPVKVVDRILKKHGGIVGTAGLFYEGGGKR